MAARISSVGTSPAAAMTRSGSAPAVCAGPFPDADARGAVLLGRRHGQPLRRPVLARDDDVDVVPAAEAVVHDAQGRQLASGGR